MSEADADHAAMLLDDKLRGLPWFVSSGVGETSEGFTIFVYAKNSREPSKLLAGNSWMGFPVVIRVIGKITPLASHLSGA